MINNFISLIKNLPFLNIDLLTVGITTAAIAVLGFVVYINNRKSITNKSFFLFCVVTVLWSFFNFVNYKIAQPELVLWLIRIVIFLGVWHSFLFFQFFYVFPEEQKIFPWWYKSLLTPYVIFVSLFTLTPFVFSGIEQLSSDDLVSKPIVEKGMIVFVATVISLLLVSIFIFIKKNRNTKEDERKQNRLILIGTIFTFTLIFTFNLILPIIFLNVRFVPFGALFVFPFIIFTAYAIYKHKLFNIKNLTSSILAFFLCLITFIEIIFADSFNLIIFRISIFILVLVISIQFIKNIFNLEAANNQKSEFMSFAAHEIRTPLTVIKGYASLILEGDLGEINKKAKDAVQKIMISSNHVITLIAQYLNKSKMELGQLSYFPVVFDMGKLIKDTAQNFKVNAEQKGIALTAEVNSSLIYNVKADEGKIREVIGNIIDNAIKYTDKGWVVVSVTKKDSKVLVKIADTGVGIPKKTMPKLFKKFSKAGIGKINLLGTGLGLFLAKTFVEAQKGRVWAESKGQDKGSQFYVELPQV